MHSLSNVSWTAVSRRKRKDGTLKATVTCFPLQIWNKSPADWVFMVTLWKKNINPLITINNRHFSIITSCPGCTQGGCWSHVPNNPLGSPHPHFFYFSLSHCCFFTDSLSYLLSLPLPLPPPPLFSFSPLSSFLSDLQLCQDFSSPPVPPPLPSLPVL